MSERKTRETAMRSVRVEWLCGVDDCAGTMENTGHGITTIHTSWNYQCSVCRRFEWADERFPRIDYRKVE